MEDPRWQASLFEELTNTELYALLRLRVDVFMLEQNCLYPELDDLDQDAVHIMCWRDSELLAYLRCLKPGASYHESSMGRIVVAPAGRGLQLGRELVQRGIEHNARQWPDSDIRIGAQAHLESFYNSLDFVTVGDQYMEDGIAHLHMVRPREER